jgi:hypothetical protein
MSPEDAARTIITALERAAILVPATDDGGGP